MSVTKEYIVQYYIPVLLLTMLMATPTIAQEPAVVAFTVKVGLMPFKETATDKLWDAVEAVPNATVIILYGSAPPMVTDTDSHGMAKFDRAPVGPYTVAVGNIKGRPIEAFTFKGPNKTKKVLVALGRGKETII